MVRQQRKERSRIADERGSVAENWRRLQNTLAPGELDELVAETRPARWRDDGRQP
jgi:hypothetical protein